jgi:2-iminobutanoate/2-iminopropanoate deaminase
MSREVICTDQAPAPVGPYSQAIAASGRLVFVSGQIALDPQTGLIVGSDDVEAQTRQVLANLQAVLAAAGASFADVVRTTVFLQDMEDFTRVNAIYGEAFDSDTAPARACVQAARLPKDVKVEIDCIAVLP